MRIKICRLLSLQSVTTILVSLTLLSGCFSFSSEDEVDEEIVTAEAEAEEAVEEASNQYTKAKEDSESALSILSKKDSQEEDLPLPPDEKASEVVLETPNAMKAQNPTNSRSNWRVWFVKDNNIVIRDKPDMTGKELGKLKRGDHILVRIKGDWAELTNSKFVQKAA